jgi:hypothetical protein
MKTWKIFPLAALSVAAAFGQGETWEVGGLGGFGVSMKYKINRGGEEAKANTKNGIVAGAFFGNDMYEYWSGEVRYLYRDSDPQLTGAGGSASLAGSAHILHGDILGHFAQRKSKVRPFIAFGGGIKRLSATGVESASQPLGRFAGLTRASEIFGVVDVGAGVKVQVSKSIRVRFEVRDYIHKRPNKVITRWRRRRRRRDL